MSVEMGSCFFTRLMLFFTLLQSTHCFASCDARVLPIFLRNLIGAEANPPGFDAGKFNEALSRFKKDFKIESVTTREEKLALFEVITAGEKSSPLNLVKFLEAATDEELGQLERILNAFNVSRKNGVSLAAAQTAVEDLYRLTHPVRSKSFLKSLFPPNARDADQLIRARFETELATQSADQALLKFANVDERTIEKTKKWLQNHTNLQNSLLSASINASPYLAVKAVEQLAGLALPNPDLALFLLSVPKLKAFHASPELIHNLQKYGTQVLKPELIAHFKNRAYAELYYDYLKKKAAQGMALYFAYYLYDHWSDQQNLFGMVRLMGSSLFLNSENLQKAQDETRSLDQGQREQVKSSLAAEYADQEKISPKVIWKATRENLRLKETDIYTNYQKSAHVPSSTSVLAPSAKQISDAAFMALSELKKDPHEFQTWAQDWMKSSEELKHKIEQQKQISPEVIWKSSESILRKQDHSVIALSAENIRDLANEALDELAIHHPEFTADQLHQYKIWIRKRALLQNVSPSH